LWETLEGAFPPRHVARSSRYGRTRSLSSPSAFPHSCHRMTPLGRLVNIGPWIFQLPFPFFRIFMKPNNNNGIGRCKLKLRRKAARTRAFLGRIRLRLFRRTRAFPLFSI
jgi:hypothetical protein